MTDDLISRQAVIDVLAAMQGRCTSKAALIQNSKICQQIKDLPSAQPEQQWIPCSERLPGEGTYVLVTEKWHGYVRMWRLQHINDEPTWEVNGFNIDIDEAVAWMPLPKPYRKGECYETD